MEAYVCMRLTNGFDDEKSWSTNGRLRGYRCLVDTRDRLVEQITRTKKRRDKAQSSFVVGPTRDQQRLLLERDLRTSFTIDFTFAINILIVCYRTSFNRPLITKLLKDIIVTTHCSIGRTTPNTQSGSAMTQ
jgi:transposase